MSGLPLFDWRPPEKIAVFPAIRHRRKIESVARAAAAAKDPEKTIAYTLRRLRESHEKRGVPAILAKEDVAKLEVAIRAMVASLLRQPGCSA